jgi:hypothetical protein
VTENTVGKQKMRLDKRENSINGLKNETASKTVINFHVMVTKALFSLNNSDTVAIEIHFLQNESQVSPLAAQWERARERGFTDG